MVKKMSRGLSLTLLLLCLWSTICLAAGSVVDEDFSCKGVMLGDSESVLRAKWGEPLYDKIVIKQGVKVKTYVYKDRSEASVAVYTGKVVDFVVDMELAINGSLIIRHATDKKRGDMPIKAEQLQHTIVDTAMELSTVTLTRRDRLIEPFTVRFDLRDEPIHLIADLTRRRQVHNLRRITLMLPQFTREREKRRRMSSCGRTLCTVKNGSHYHTCYRSQTCSCMV